MSKKKMKKSLQSGEVNPAVGRYSGEALPQTSGDIMLKGNNTRGIQEGGTTPHRLLVV